MCNMNNSNKYVAKDAISTEDNDDDDELESDDEDLEDEEEVDENVGKEGNFGKQTNMFAASKSKQRDKLPSWIQHLSTEKTAPFHVIDVAFDARPPCDSDFHGIKRLLQQLFVKYINDELSELSNLIVAQDFVGCVLKQDPGDDSEDSYDDDDDDDNVFAVSTVINISENQHMSCIEKINDLLISKCEENYKAEPSRMATLIRDPSKQIGFLISERFINIPPQVALPSYQSLKSDIETAVRKKRKFDFSHLVLISKTYKAKSAGPLGDELFFSNSEEQLFKEMSEFSFTFSVADQRDSLSDGTWDENGGEFESLRTIMVFDASALGQMIVKLQTELQQNS